MRPTRWSTAAPWLAATALAVAAVLRLLAVLPDVANRYAFGWDSARRAVLNARAGDALRRGHLLDFLWYVGGPETWPTLRLVPASIVHAIAGPSSTFGVEHGLSIVTVGGIAIAVAYAARALAVNAAGATVVTLLAVALLAANGALLVHAANGMLEPLSAALTTAAVAAWIAARVRGTARPWALAVFANLVFHTKWQHGLLVALAVLCLEWIDPGESPRDGPARDAPGKPPRRSGAIAGTLDVLVQGARTRLGAVLIIATALLFALAVAIAVTGGGTISLAGVPIGLRTVHGPIAYGALTAFLFVEGAFWRARVSLRDVLPDRLRFAWAWVATPMAAWLLVPATWRLRTILVTSGTYDSGEVPSGEWARIWFYPEAAWHGWTVPSVHPVIVALIAATAVAAWRSPFLRRRLVPILVLVALEWTVLTFGTRHNFQARFFLNLAPIVAVALCAWAAALPARWAVAAGAAALIGIAMPASATWSRERLVTTVSEGFDPADHARACRDLMERLPVERLKLIDRAPLSHRQGCALWATVIARQRGEHHDPNGMILVTGVNDVNGGNDAAPEFRGYRQTGDLSSGPLRARIYERAR